jgi:hypothetical protein
MPTLLRRNGKLLMRGGRILVARSNSAADIAACCEPCEYVPPAPPILPHNCCFDPPWNMVWPGDFPDVMFVRISGSCCASLNSAVLQIAKLTTGTGATNPYYTSENTPPAFITGCGGPPNTRLTSVLQCTNNQWFLSLGLSGYIQDPVDPCLLGGIPAFGQTLNFHGCDPLYFTGTGETIEGDCADPNKRFGCAGPFTFTITES